MGVADGVGGWEESGIDPSHFAQCLMWNARRAVEGGVNGPREVMEKAYEGVTQEKGVLAGGVLWRFGVGVHFRRS